MRVIKYTNDIDAKSVQVDDQLVDAVPRNVDMDNVSAPPANISWLSEYQLMDDGDVLIAPSPPAQNAPAILVSNMNPVPLSVDSVIELCTKSSISSLPLSESVKLEAILGLAFGKAIEEALSQAYHASCAKDKATAARAVADEKAQEETFKEAVKRTHKIRLGKHEGDGDGSGLGSWRLIPWVRAQEEWMSGGELVRSHVACARISFRWMDCGNGFVAGSGSHYSCIANGRQSTAAS